MFRHILIPIDGRASATITVPFAHDIVERFGGRMDVLRVVPEAAGADRVAVETAQVEQVVAHECSQGFKARAYVERGHVEDVITQTVKAHHSDLIVLAPQPRRGLDQLVHPSVTARMVARSLAPVLIVPEQQGELHDVHLLGTSASLVIVPIDGSAVAERAIPYATTLADAFNRVLVFVHVDTPTANLGSTQGGQVFESDMRDIRDMRHYLGTLRHHVALETGLTVQSMQLAGNPAQEIARIAQSHDMSLIVMSTHGRGRLGRAVLGSVASEMLRTTATPLLIVPPPEHLVVDPAYGEHVHSENAARS